MNMLNLIGIYIFIVGIISGCCYFNCIKLDNKTKDKYKSLLYGLFMFCFIIRLLTIDNFEGVKNILILNKDIANNGIIYESRVMYLTILIIRILTQGCAFSLLISRYFKYDSGYRINAYIVPIVYGLDLIFFNQISHSFCGLDNHMFAFKTSFFALECLSAILIGFYELKEYSDKNLIKLNKSIIKKMIYLLIAFCLLTLNNGVICNLFGEILPICHYFNISYFIALSLPIIMFTILYHNFKDKDMELKRYVLICLSLCIVIRHWYLYSNQDGSPSYPLTWCWANCMLMPFAMIYDNKNLRNVMLINAVVGATAAMLMPTPLLDDYIFTRGGIHFLSNHSMLLFVPLLAYAFGYYQKVTFKDMKGIFKFNAIYFAVLLYFNLAYPTNSYFYLNNNDAIDMVKFIYDFTPLRVNYVIQFEFLNKTRTIYYHFWPFMYLLINLLSLAAFGLHKIYCLLLNKIYKVK